MKSLKTLVAILMLSIIATACGGSGEEPTTPDPLRLRNQSISNGTEVDADNVNQLVLNFNAVVEVISQKATLNGIALNATANGMDVTIPLSLEKGKSYRLVIPSGCIARKDNAQSIDDVTIEFTTKEAAKPLGENLQSLTDANATKEAKNVYNFLKENYGKKILSGVQNTKAYITDFADEIHTTTGKYPAVSGYDFIFIAWPADTWYGNYEDISYLKKQWDNKGLVSLTWHWNVASNEADIDTPDKMGFYISGKNGGNGETTFDIREALKEGTWQNKVILRDIERVAKYLKILQDANIPVLWRPLHEAAGDYKYGAWFWWGRYGVEYTKELYKLMYDKLVNKYGLHNLIWIWTSQTTCEGKFATNQQMMEAYPGDEYVDIVGLDLYYGSKNVQEGSHYDVFNLANSVFGGRKMITLSECGNVFDPDECIAGGDAWSWFMSWCDNGYTNWNSDTIWKHVMSAQNVINREDMPNLK